MDQFQIIFQINLFGHFAIDNDLSRFEYNDINTTLKLNKFATTFNYIKELGDMDNKIIFK